MRRPKRT